ncbi:polypeptide N-acetylgalactosaminyltransferase 10 isoform X2 [Gasterosteus aculeatus]|uniref:polypeptide N-acetylgalactosaminyltransferase 10-like isoform X2 n=1 Tax=Gasterosteus aculeatus aculeatus TaxID=481459 RepID=UPI0000E39FCD|nr:polypeptide N-acetylgalactosaminyltransferase 10-like isoform X2 [Gasterosteus aculeatus aculeatus]
MRRKEKRLLQVAGLLVAALLFLPNVGLWSLYRDRVFENSPDAADGGPGGAVLRTQGSNQARKVAHVGPDGVRRTDWHDYEAMRRDAARSGNGEQGKPFPLSESDRADQAYRENGFNIYISNQISLNRSVPDIRHANCKRKLYAEKLPNTSIIIPFHNEGWSSLLRTVHSVLNRSPPQLLAEVILVDDFSDKEHLKGALEEYMTRMPKVRVLRTRKREGLIRTRLLGAAAAKGEVITFLDSHCEANANWLPPLLDRIAQNRKTIVCPMIDVIDHDNFGYDTQAGDAMRGAFDWEMYYKRIPIPPELQSDDPSEPFESPVMAGGLFAIDRKWFWELGGYDTGLEIWGGEQYEISFKVWMCGGRMEDIPCSRVGHIYRKYVPYKVPGGISLAKNLKRVAEVWMDEYGEYVYQRRPEYRHLSAGDMTAQKELRNRLNCKTFKWFMSEVAWDLPKHYPMVEPPAAAWGEIRNVGSGMCMEIKHFVSGSPVRLESCVKGRGEVAWSHGQVLTFGWREDIRVGDPVHTRKVCFDAVSHSSPVTLYDCHGMRGNQLWRYREDKSLYHPVSNSCIDSSPSERRVFMNTCDASSLSQQWMFERTNATVLELFNRAAN